MFGLLQKRISVLTVLASHRMFMAHSILRIVEVQKAMVHWVKKFSLMKRGRVIACYLQGQRLEVKRLVMLEL